MDALDKSYKLVCPAPCSEIIIKSSKQDVESRFQLHRQGFKVPVSYQGVCLKPGEECCVDKDGNGYGSCPIGTPSPGSGKSSTAPGGYGSEHRPAGVMLLWGPVYDHYNATAKGVTT